MEQFDDWFSKNSPYRLHRCKKQQFSTEACCGKEPKKTTNQLRHDHPETGQAHWFWLYRCSSCGTYFITWNGRFRIIDSLLKYPVREGPSREPGAEK